jgi:hypothetical protein
MNPQKTLGRMLVSAICAAHFSVALFAAESPPTLPEPATFALEREKFVFEKANEDRKAQYELIKAIIAGVSIALPILIGIYTLRAQSVHAFELKAAEIVMGASNPGAIKRKAEILKEIFPTRLSKDFVKLYDPAKYTFVGPNVSSKMELLKLLTEHPDQHDAILELWRRMFPDDRIDQLFPGDTRKP